MEATERRKRVSREFCKALKTSKNILRTFRKTENETVNS